MVRAETLIPRERDDVTGEHVQVGLADPGNLKRSQGCDRHIFPK
jgi:hypothetical protein